MDFRDLNFLINRDPSGVSFPLIVSTVTSKQMVLISTSLIQIPFPKVWPTFVVSDWTSLPRHSPGTFSSTHFKQKLIHSQEISSSFWSSCFPKGPATFQTVPSWLWKSRLCLSPPPSSLTPDPISGWGQCPSCLTALLHSYCSTTVQALLFLPGEFQQPSMHLSHQGSPYPPAPNPTSILALACTASIVLHSPVNENISSWDSVSSRIEQLYFPHSQTALPAYSIRALL